MTDLRTAALRVLEAWQDQKGMKLLCEAMDDLGEALSQPEDKSQAAFEHWVETVEATQGCAISRNAVADATCKQSLQVEPCNKSCAPGYCYCEPIIKPEIKGHNAEPPPEAQTEAERVAYCAGWWAAMEAKRGQKMRDAGYTRRPTLREMAEPVQEPEQEPVAWRYKAMMGMPWSLSDDVYYVSCKLDNGYMVEPLYTHTSRQWQGLTEEEMFHVENNVPDSVISDRQWTVYFARALENKLKELNHD